MYIFPLFFLGALYSGQSFCIYMGCTDIGYCIYDICGFYGWFWFSFMVMYFWLCVWMYVYGCVRVCFWVMCLDTGSRSSARPGSINIGAYLSLGPVSIIIGTYSLLEAHFHHHWDLLSSRGPFHHHWDLLLHEAHLNDSPNFLQFFSTKMEKFAPVCSVKQIFLAS
jgi:hypothetical protein